MIPAHYFIAAGAICALSIVAIILSIKAIITSKATDKKYIVEVNIPTANNNTEDRSNEAQDNTATSDKLEMLRLYQEDFLFRHTLYWNLFYKTIGAILGLLALPHAL